MRYERQINREVQLYVLIIFQFRKSLKAAKKGHDTHAMEIKKLEDEFEEVERLRQEYEESVEEESQSQGRDMELEESQVRWIETGVVHFLSSVTAEY